MPAMDEGAFVLDYFAPTGTPLERTEELARVIEQVLMENPDVEVYVRRAGTQLGMFATKTNRGDHSSRVAFRRRGVPSICFTKPVRLPSRNPSRHGRARQDGRREESTDRSTRIAAVARKESRSCANSIAADRLPKIMEEMRTRSRNTSANTSSSVRLIKIMQGMNDNDLRRRWK